MSTRGRINCMITRQDDSILEAANKLEDEGCEVICITPWACDGFAVFYRENSAKPERRAEDWSFPADVRAMTAAEESLIWPYSDQLLMARMTEGTRSWFRTRYGLNLPDPAALERPDCNSEATDLPPS